MLAARMALARRGRLCPLRQRALTLGCVGRDRPAEPVVETLRGVPRSRVLGEEVSQIVVAHPAADNEHALVPQRLERTADTQMLCRIEAGLQRKLQHRHLGLRVDELERHEYAVIEPALAFFAG